jgi:hypothetical protein
MLTSPFPSSFTISLVRVDGTTVCLEAHGAAAVGHCPACGLPSDQVHEPTSAGRWIWRGGGISFACS